MDSPATTLDRRVWLSALADLGKSLGHTEVERWLSDADLVELKDRFATLALPSRLHLEWVRKHHLPAICSVLCVPECRLEVREADIGAILSEPEQALAAEVSPPPPATMPVATEPQAPSAPDLTPLILNPDYTFDNYVIGPCNRLAAAAARGVAESPASAINPLFLHGSVGLGKTHLMQGIAHQLLAARPGLNIVFLSCEQFVNHFIQALKQGDINSFRSRYRKADLLVVDDVQVLANKVRTQEEFFHTFNELHNARKQIVLSSDSPPEEIKDLQDRLISRFKWGLVAEIEPPCFEVRVAILQKKAERLGLELPEDAAKFIGEHIENNVRELEGTLTKTLAMATFYNRKVDLALAKEVLAPMLKNRPRTIRVDDILDVVCRHFGAKVGDLQSKKRTQSIVFPRQIAMFLARQLTEHSLSEIGGYFGGRDHSTVVYALERIEARRRVDSDFSVTISELERLIRLEVQAN